MNRIIQAYRLATYDYFPYEVSPWDVPIWLIRSWGPAATITLFPYAAWDNKPRIESMGDPSTLKTYELINPEDLSLCLGDQPSPGEIDLMDALNLMERGDYSGAVRRIATAIEVITEAALRAELEKNGLSENQTQDKLYRINEIDRRIKLYANIGGREIPDPSLNEWKTTRELRRRIVHEGYRISYADRGSAQRAVDTGRWFYNWLENRPERAQVREGHIATRSLGRHMAWNAFDAEITPDGVVVQRPF